VLSLIRDIAEVFDGPHSTPKKTEAGPYFLSISSLQQGRLDLSKSAHLSEQDYIKWTKRVTPAAGDLLFSYETRLGEAAIMPDGIRGCLGRRMGLLRPDRKKVVPEYLLYAYLAPHFQQTIISNTITGATVDRLAINEFPMFGIRIPAISEQRKVAKMLSDIDAKIELNNRINAELEAMAKTLYDYWFVQFDFPFDFAQGKPDAKGRPYKSSGGKMVYNDQLKRKIPEGWSDGTLDDVGQVVGGSTPSTKNPDNFSISGIPWITPNDLSGNQLNKFIARGAVDVSEAGIKAASLKKFPAGTVLLTSRAPIGYMAIAREEVTTNQGFKSFIPSKGYSSAVVFYMVKNALQTIMKHGSGSTFKEISGTVLKMVPVCLPSPEVADAFTAKIDSVFNRQDLLEQENQQLTILRDFLLPMLMNGQVQVV
jgi:type I restriction enzyme S subunit